MPSRDVGYFVGAGVVGCRHAASIFCVGATGMVGCRHAGECFLCECGDGDDDGGAWVDKNI